MVPLLLGTCVNHSFEFNYDRKNLTYIFSHYLLRKIDSDTEPWFFDLNYKTIIVSEIMFDMIEDLSLVEVGYKFEDRRSKLSCSAKKGR